MQQTKQSILRIVSVNLAVFLALALALIFVAEMGLRHFIPGADHSGMMRLTSTPIAYEMIPNLYIVREGVKIRTNSDGFRDSEFKDNSKPGKFVIAVLGDSFTFGQGVSQSETFPVILQKLLNRSNNADRFRVWNLGVSGYNTEQEAYQLQHFVLDRKPNWVVVGYNINDVEPIGVDPSLVRKEEKSQESSIGRLAKYIENDLLITQFVKQRIGNLIRLFDPNWYASSYVQDTVNQYLAPDGAWRKEVSVLLEKMKTECDSRGVGFTVALLPAMLDFKNYPFKKGNDVILEFCRNNKIDCIDTLSYFKNEKFMSLWVSSMDPHPNAQAQRIYAKAIADHLNGQIPTKSK
ncbi:MAG: SGNH/GDSL hydrolase family protein [Desulfomonilaceae bacterium]